MIESSINILTRTIPSTPRSSNYPQGWSFPSGIQSPGISSLSDGALLSLIKSNKAEVMSALRDRGILNLEDEMSDTGTIYGGQTW